MIGGNMSSSKGFTLIEILVVTAIFGVLITAMAGIFVSALRTERSILASKKVLGQLSYTVEYMSRALRMAEKDKTGTCIPSGSNYQITGRNGIRFINAIQASECQEFFLDDNGQLNHETPTGTAYLTSSDITIDNLTFDLSGQTETDNLQPFVTIYLEAYTAESPITKLQTSISQRNPDIR